MKNIYPFGNLISTYAPQVIPPFPWYLAYDMTASDIILAYQAKNNYDLANSYKNIAGNTAYNAYPVGVSAPTWDKNYGWYFNGKTQYLKTPLIPSSIEGTLLVRYIVNSKDYWGSCIDVTSSDNDWLHAFGFSTANNSNGQVYYQWGEAYIDSSKISTTGVLGVNKNGGYLNGALDKTFGATPSQVGTQQNLYVGVTKTATFGFGTSQKILCMAYYSKTLTAPQILAISNKMSAL